MEVEDLPLLPNVSFDAFCRQIADEESVVKKFALLAILPERFKNESFTSSQVDRLLTALDPAILVDLFQNDLSEGKTYSNLAVEILASLSPMCDSASLTRYRCITKGLVRRLEDNIQQPAVLDPVLRVLLYLQNGNLPALTRILDVLSESVMGTEKLPPTVLIQRSLEFLESLNDLQLSPKEESSLLRSSWSRNYRTLASRILFSRPENISDELYEQIFAIVGLCSNILGVEWFAPEPQLLAITSHLNTARIRICLERPESIDCKALIYHFMIAEVCIKAVEDAEFLDDEQASKVSRAVQETAQFSIQFWCAAMSSDEDGGELLSPEVQFILYRFVSVFLSIGGAKIINEKIFKPCGPLLLAVLKQTVKNDDFTSAYLLIPHLDELVDLTSDVVTVLVDFVVRQHHPTGHWNDAADDIVDAIRTLRARCDWYDAETLAAAIVKANTIPNKSLVQTLQRYV